MSIGFNIPDEKEKAREKLLKDTAEYLERGGSVTVVGTGLTSEALDNMHMERYRKRAQSSQYHGHKKFNDGKGVEAGR